MQSYSVTHVPAAELRITTLAMQRTVTRSHPDGEKAVIGMHYAVNAFP